MKNAQEQFAEAYTKYSEDLFRYGFFRVNDRELAKDLIQETFMKAWRYMEKDPASVLNIRAFLYKILGNLIIDQYRKRRDEASLEVLHEEGFDPAFDDTSRWADVLDGEQARVLLKQVPEPYREAVLLRYVEDLSLTEIAKITGVSQNTISVRVHRGIDKLREIYNSKK